jgi:hypothetical protein
LIYCLFICLCCLFSIVLPLCIWARRSRLWAAVSGRARQVTLDHFISICFLPLIYTSHPCINWLPKPSYFRTWFYGWVVLLSPAVLYYHISLPSLWYWVWLVLSDDTVGFLMWGDRGKTRCCVLSKIEMVEMVGFR